jgi:hypothetical protein
MRFWLLLTTIVPTFIYETQKSPAAGARQRIVHHQAGLASLALKRSSASRK